MKKKNTKQQQQPKKHNFVIKYSLYGAMFPMSIILSLPFDSSSVCLSVSLTFFISAAIFIPPMPTQW